jgi:hypothetical protein
MTQSRGSVRFQPLFTTQEVGLSENASVAHVVKVFLTVGEAIAARWIEMPKGVLILQVVPDEAASGAIYLYDRERRVFFFVDFAEGRDDSLSPADFDELMSEYNLVSWAANPSLLPANIPKLGNA